MRYKTRVRMFRMYHGRTAIWSGPHSLQTTLRDTDLTDEEIEKIISLKPGCTLRLSDGLRIRREKLQ